MNDNQEPQTFVDLPGAIRPAMVGNMHSEGHITVEPDVNDPSKVCWRLSEQAWNLATVDHRFCGPCPGSIKTLICKDGARPTNLAIPAVHQASIQTIILENGHIDYLDTAAFPNLRAIVCKKDEVMYPARNLDRAGCDLSDWDVTEESIHRQQAEIHRQIIPQLPRWMQALVLDPNRQIELSIRVVLDFRTREEEEAPILFYWDGKTLKEVARPPWFIPVCILYSWSAGRSYWALRSPKKARLIIGSVSNTRRFR
ncbi:hypothetical protein CLAIMM_02399 [Cladophialophora immunda]|nr:hypothetical protein CLAIMM_02399 [Cladophialophora immunda]